MVLRLAQPSGLTPGRTHSQTTEADSLPNHLACVSAVWGERGQERGGKDKSKS